MRRIFSFLAAFVLFAAAERAEANGVGLGAGVGVAIPDTSAPLEYDPALNWGFFVDIPLISTFHITPSTLVYGLNPKGAIKTAHVTDVSLNFKFVIPLGAIEPFAGVTAGLTAASTLDPHVGLLAGLSINIVANIDVFAQLNYRVILQDDANTRDFHVYAGPLFRFY